MAKLIKLYNKATIPQDVQKDIGIKIVDYLVKEILKKITNDADEYVLNCNDDQIITKKEEVFDDGAAKGSYKGGS